MTTKMSAMTASFPRYLAVTWKHSAARRWRIGEPCVLVVLARVNAATKPRSQRFASARAAESTVSWRSFPAPLRR